MRSLKDSRYILAWKLFPTMSATDVQETLDLAFKRTGLEHVKVRLNPRLLSDNGPCYVSKDLQAYLEARDILHVRSAPYHPQTQGKIERYHRTIKNVINLEHDYFPGELEKAITEFVEYYNYQRYHEAIDNLIPADMFYGKGKEIWVQREKTKYRT
jgi:transposase InsO family protein